MVIQFRYQAFISYSHQDAAIANWLFDELERFRLPAGVSAPEVEAPLRRLGKFFKDEEELGASANLSEAIQSALNDARALIVICSPASAKSQWVAREIDYFRNALGRRNVFAVLADGDPNGALEAERCFPPLLIGEGFEPLAADLRSKKKSERRDGVVRLVAGLCDIDLDALRQRELARARRQAVRNGFLAMGAAVLAIGAMAAGGYALYANSRLTAALSAEEEARADAEQALVRERIARESEERANALAEGLGESGEYLFENINASAIGYSRALTSWSPSKAGQSRAVLLGSPQSEPHSSLSYTYWQKCPRNLADCFTSSNIPIEQRDMQAVALQGDAEVHISASAREQFEALCKKLTGPSRASVLRACRNALVWDRRVDDIPAVLYAYFDERAGAALFKIESRAYCGSGGCSHPLQLWVGRDDGNYVATTLAGSNASDSDDERLSMDEAALVSTSEGLELVTVSRGQIGAASQFAEVQRFQVDFQMMQLQILADFYFQEDSDGLQPTLTICANAPTPTSVPDAECY